MDDIKTNIDKVFDYINLNKVVDYRAEISNVFESFGMRDSSKNRSSGSSPPPPPMPTLSSSSIKDKACPASKKRKLSSENIYDTLDSNKFMTSNGQVNIIDDDTEVANLSNININNISTNESTALNNNIDSTLNNSSVLVDESLSNKKWELRVLKYDLSSCQLSYAHAKKELEALTLTNKELNTMFTSKVDTLQKQLEFSEQKSKQLEKTIRQSEKQNSASRAEIVKLNNLLKQQKFDEREKLSGLETENKDLIGKLNTIKCDKDNEISSLKLQISELEHDLICLNSQMEIVEHECKVAREKADVYDTLQEKLTNDANELEMLHERNKELERELVQYGEWKELSKTFQNNLLRLPDLEKENDRLKHEMKLLSDNIGDKLLLEEQAYDLKTRIEKYEKQLTGEISHKYTIESLEEELEEWKSVAANYCLTNGNKLVIPKVIHERINELMEKELLLTNERSILKRERDAASAESQKLNKDMESLKKMNTNLEVQMKLFKVHIQKYQKKLALVVKERDFYKDLLEQHEKDLTISGTCSEMHTNPQLRLRMEMLEKTLSGYKEINLELEKELKIAKPQIASTIGEIDVSSSFNSEVYERLKGDLEKLRNENERLRLRNDELERHIEQSTLKDAYEIEKYKVLHMASNPATEATENHMNKIEKLQAEIERLRRKNKKLELGHTELTTRLNETADLTMNIKEMTNMKEQIVSLENKNKHMKSSFHEIFEEFSSMTYMLFGFKLDRLGNRRYRASSIYEQRADPYLYFEFNDNGGVDVLESEYFGSIDGDITIHLEKFNSIPVFLSHLTLDIYNSKNMEAD